MWTRILAFVCAICPFCRYARRHPDSDFAKKLEVAERNCPFCNAYRKLHS